MSTYIQEDNYTILIQLDNEWVRSRLPEIFSTDVQLSIPQIVNLTWKTTIRLRRSFNFNACHVLKHSSEMSICRFECRRRSQADVHPRREFYHLTNLDRHRRIRLSICWFVHRLAVIKVITKRCEERGNFTDRCLRLRILTESACYNSHICGVCSSQARLVLLLTYVWVWDKECGERGNFIHQYLRLRILTESAC